MKRNPYLDILVKLYNNKDKIFKTARKLVHTIHQVSSVTTDG